MHTAVSSGGVTAQEGITQVTTLLRFPVCRFFSAKFRRHHLIAGILAPYVIPSGQTKNTTHVSSTNDVRRVHLYIHMYVHEYICVYTCVCVYVFNVTEKIKEVMNLRGSWWA